METGVHPFRRHFEEIQIGESLLTPARVIRDEDVHAFGHLTGDMFYMHFDDEAAKASPFGQRIAHGYLVLSDAAGLFVVAEPGPVLANYGLDTLRFVKPVAHRRQHPGAPDLQAQDRPQQERRQRQRPGRGGLGRGSEEPARRAGRQLRHPDAGGEEGLKAPPARKKARRPVGFFDSVLIADFDLPTLGRSHFL